MCHHEPSHAAAGIPFKALVTELRSRCETASCLQGGSTYFHEEIGIFRQYAEESGLYLTEPPAELIRPATVRDRRHPGPAQIQLRRLQEIQLLIAPRQARRPPRALHHLPRRGRRLGRQPGHRLGRLGRSPTGARPLRPLPTSPGILGLGPTPNSPRSSPSWRTSSPGSTSGTTPSTPNTTTASPPSTNPSTTNSLTPSA